jgi:hypothetical protein
MCGRVPHFTGGTLHGRVLVRGRDTRGHRPRDLADVVGVVGQDPLAGFVTDTVEEELAYGMEQLGTAPETMRRRVEETLDRDEEGVEIEAAKAGLRRNPVHGESSLGEGWAGPGPVPPGSVNPAPDRLPKCT